MSIKSKVLSIIPDSLYIRLLYYKKLKTFLNLKAPKLFTEKIQWLKLYDRNPYYTQLVDKSAVKKIVAEKIGSEYLLKTLGEWKTFEEIDFTKLPNQFVLKTTHDSGGVVICKDKAIFDTVKAKTKINESLGRNFYKEFREYPYKKVPPRIIAEEFLGSIDEDLVDYKIYCFNGVPKFIQVIKDRSSKETIDFFDTLWNHQEFVGFTPGVANSDTPVRPPQNLNKMLEIAASLSSGIPFLRVDLYNVEGTIKFGELTFSPNAGFGCLHPDKWNRILGDMIELPDSIGIIR